ncbi:hypothetical protein BDY21DRAFT_21001 [Lineolata rhizophorae]|uniref:Uncharacterized protein n=1 Tax=Lineolata rhizophorae TaxID=578093 RepID=A0A6A6P2N6_9PEZI|nr:hypothetical protein BDY21DRAFT_21001 [Lineolata rhizophorae]
MSGRGRDSWRPAAPARNGDPRSSRLLSPPQVPDVYSFHGGDSYRPSPPDGPRRQARSQRGDFRFRSDVPASRFSRDDVAYNPMRTRRDLQFRHGDRASGPSNRPILRSSKEKTPEQFDGMTDGNARFKPLEDLSESENEMDISVASDNEESGPEAKRARISSVPTEEEAAKPKWSNPDPYSSTSTLLDAGPSKAKGVMQLIKKAKAASLKEDTKPIANNADFISFDDGDQSDDESSSESYSPTLKSRLASGSRGLEDPTGKQPPQAASFAATGGFTAINDNSATSAEASGGFAAINSNNATSAEAFSHSETYLRLNLTGYQPPVPNRKRKREEISGEVVQGWKGAESNNNPTPWVAEGLPELADVSLW